MTRLVSIFICVFVSQIVEAKFLQNLNDLKNSKASTGEHAVQGASRKFLKTIESSCQILGQETDGTYFKNSPSKQSWQSAQSRLCATVIYQYRPQVNIFQVDMKGCRKFTGDMLQCCLAFEEGYKKTKKDSAERSKISVIAELLCKEVPSYFEYANDYQRRRRPASSANQSDNEARRGDGGFWSYFLLLKQYVW